MHYRHDPPRPAPGGRNRKIVGMYPPSPGGVPVDDAPLSGKVQKCPKSSVSTRKLFLTMGNMF